MAASFQQGTEALNPKAGTPPIGSGPMSDWSDEVLEAARAALAPMEGTLEAPGLREPVEILRDRWGIPYVSAASLEDLWFAQGFVTASERLFQIDLALRAAEGRLSDRKSTRLN